MERNLAAEYRVRKFREDQVRENVREMEEREREKAIAAYEAKGDVVLDEG